MIGAEKTRNFGKGQCSLHNNIVRGLRLSGQSIPDYWVHFNLGVIVGSF
jgi:hypothetical protein